MQTNRTPTKAETTLENRKHLSRQCQWLLTIRAGLEELSEAGAGSARGNINRIVILPRALLDVYLEFQRVRKAAEQSESQHFNIEFSSLTMLTQRSKTWVHPSKTGNRR